MSRSRRGKEADFVVDRLVRLVTWAATTGRFMGSGSVSLYLRPQWEGE